MGGSGRLLAVLGELSRGLGLLIWLDGYLVGLWVFLATRRGRKLQSPNLSFVR